MAKEIPVYLFVGFLESGKTKFIQETFEDPNFDSGDKTLLLVCEEGEEEYNQKKFAFPGVTVDRSRGQGRAEPPEPGQAGQGSRRRPRGHRVQRHVAAAGSGRRPARELAGVPVHRHRRRHHRPDLRPRQLHAQPDAGQDRPQRADRVQPRRSREQRRRPAGAAQAGASGLPQVRYRLRVQGRQRSLRRYPRPAAL